MCSNKLKTRSNYFYKNCIIFSRAFDLKLKNSKQLAKFLNKHRTHTLEEGIFLHSYSQK